MPTTWLIAGAVAASGFVMAGVQTVRLDRAKAASVKLQAAWDAERITLLTAAVTATTQARDTETRWQDRQKEALNVAQKVTDQARADAADLRSTLDRLRQRDAARAACSCPAAQGAGTAGPGASTGEAAPLPADVLSRAAEAAAELAEFADRAVIAGQACESSWPSR